MAAETCDVLVVGGGPAGSTCARQLRRAGLDVLVMDKQAFPRDKVCAGWITPAVVASLELDLEDYAKGRVLQPIRGFRIGTIGGADAAIRYDEPASYAIRRCEFDHYLLQRSTARLASGEPARSMVRDGAAWVVNGRIRTPLVVGAGQEHGLRPGTENVAFIVGLGAACALAGRVLQSSRATMASLSTVWWFGTYTAIA